MKKHVFLTTIAIIIMICLLCLSACTTDDLIASEPIVTESASEAESESNTEYTMTQTETESDVMTEESPTETETDMPLEEVLTEAAFDEAHIIDPSYLGRWTNQYNIDEIVIYNINADSFKFYALEYRVAYVNTTAIRGDGEFLFGYEEERAGDAKGRIRFEDDGITIIFDDLGYDDSYYDSSSPFRILKFDIKDEENSEKLIEICKEHNQSSAS